MATWEFDQYFEYDLDSGDIYDIGTLQTINFTMDDGDGAGDIFFTFGEDMGTGNALNFFIGSVDIPLSGGGTMTLPSINSTVSDQILIMIPAGMTSADFVFPATVDRSTFDTGSFATCFAAGSGIATPSGETLIDCLEIGDSICTADGGVVTVRWIGRQTVHRLFAGPRMQPVCISAGALGNDLPHTDLTVTADHGMVIDGLCINASALINGTTIDWVPMDELPDEFTYYHIETENHDIILANGAPAETFVDAATRASFDNYQEYLNLYGVERVIPEMIMPRISSQRLLPDSIRARLKIGTNRTLPVTQRSA